MEPAKADRPGGRGRMLVLCLLGEGAVVILQELVELFHIGNFLSVKEDEFDGIGFLILRRCGNNPSGTQPVFSYQNSLSV